MGSAARVLKNMGILNLVLVDPQVKQKDEATEWACRAAHLIDNAPVFDNLQSALKDYKIVAGTSGRNRTLTPPLIDIRELPVEIEKRQGKAAIVFGPEQSGLTTDDLSHCNFCVNIPSNPKSPSLNLAQSIALTAWELRRFVSGEGLRQQEEISERTDADEIEALMSHAQDALAAIDFLHANKETGPLLRLRKIFDNAALSHSDVQFLRGIFRQIDNYSRFKK